MKVMHISQYRWLICLILAAGTLLTGCKPASAPLAETPAVATPLPTATSLPSPTPTRYRLRLTNKTDSLFWTSIHGNSTAHQHAHRRAHFHPRPDRTAHAATYSHAPSSGNAALQSTFPPRWSALRRRWQVTAPLEGLTICTAAGSEWCANRRFHRGSQTDPRPRPIAGRRMARCGGPQCDGRQRPGAL